MFNSKGLSVLLIITVLNSGCALINRKRDEANQLMNPTRIHTSAKETGRAYEASKIPVDDYYLAMKLAESKYTYSGIQNLKTDEEWSKVAVTAFQPSDKKYISNYVNEGIGLVDAYCIRWFQRVEDLQRLVEYETKNVNIISQLGTTLLGVGSANSVIITSYGALNTAFAGATDTFDKAFLVAPATAKVRDHIQSAMKSEADVMKAAAKNNDMTFKEAYTRLENYAGFCTYAKAKEIVNASLDKTKSTSENQQISTQVKTAAELSK